MQDFTTGNPTKQIISFTLPMLLGNVFQQLYSMADAAVVGRFVGGDALAAVGTSGPLINFLLAVIMGLTTGASVLISQFYGAGREDDLKRAVSTSVIFMGALTLVIMTLGIALSPMLLRLLDVPEGISRDALIYLRIVLGGLLFMLIYNVYVAYLRALGDARYPLYFLIFSTVLNVALDTLFVAVFKMGVAGAAIATVIAQSLAALPCILYANRRVPLLRIRKWIYDRALLGSILRYSVPAAIQLSVVSLASLTIQRLINGFGANAIAGLTAATKIDSFATMPISSISAAISTFVAQNMGAGQLPRAKKGLKSATILALGLGVFMTALALGFGPMVISALVAPNDPNRAEIISVGVRYLNIIAASYSLFSIFFSFNGFFRGVGDAVIVMALTITSLTIRSVAAHILVNRFGMGPEAVACSIPIGWSVCALAAFVYYRRDMWAGKVLG